MKIVIDISSCKECPFFKITDTSSTDGFDSGDDWHCGKAQKPIEYFVEWHEKPAIPEWCPAKEGFQGSIFSQPTANITLGCISPEARDLLDTILDEWNTHYEDLKLNITTATNGETSDPSIYMFAYWLVRWSGLIQPVSQNEK